MEKHLLPKALHFWKKKSHTFHPTDWSTVTVSCWLEKKTYPKQAEPSNDEPTNAKSLFQFPEKKKHRRTSIFWRLGLFFGGKKPPNLRNINFQQEKHLDLLGLNIRLSCLVVNLNFRLFIPSNSQGFEMGAKCSSGYELGEILLRCVVPVFSPKTQAIPCGGEGVGQKNFEQSALFSRNLVEKTNWNFQKNMNSQWIDHSIVFED